jgi:hypothetical protein
LIIGSPSPSSPPTGGGEFLIEIRKRAQEMNPQYSPFLEVIIV